MLSTRNTVKNKYGKLATVQKTLTSVQILALNATPIEVIPAPGANKLLKVVSAVCIMTYSTAAYATQTTVNLITDTATVEQGSFTAVLAATASKTQGFVPQGTVAAGGTQLIANKSVKAQVPTADPTAGSGTAKIIVTYEVVDLN